jgi:hypothetical protein
VITIGAIECNNSNLGVSKKTHRSIKNIIIPFVEDGMAP